MVNGRRWDEIDRDMLAAIHKGYNVKTRILSYAGLHQDRSDRLPRLINTGMIRVDTSDQQGDDAHCLGKFYLTPKGLEYLKRLDNLLNYLDDPRGEDRVEAEINTFL